MHEAVAKGTTFAQGLLERVEHEAACAVREARQPTILRANVSMTKADVDEAGPSRLTLSCGQGAALSLTVVLNRLGRARRLANPWPRISRSTVQRATLSPSRSNCRQTLRTAINLEIVVEDAPGFSRAKPHRARALAEPFAGSRRVAACAR